MPLATVYHRAAEATQGEIWVSEEEIAHGASEIVCPDCNATGVFELPDGQKQRCVPCKGEGVLPVVLS